MINNKVLLLLGILIVIFLCCKENSLKEKFSNILADHENWSKPINDHYYLGRTVCQLKAINGECSDNNITKDYCQKSCDEFEECKKKWQEASNDISKCDDFASSHSFCKKFSENDFEEEKCIKEKEENNYTDLLFDTMNKPITSGRWKDIYDGRTECQYRASIKQCNQTNYKRDCKKSCAQEKFCTEIWNAAKNDVEKCKELDKYKYCSKITKGYNKNDCTIQNSKDNNNDKINIKDLGVDSKISDWRKTLNSYDMTKCQYYAGKGYCTNGDKTQFMKDNCAKTCLIYETIKCNENENKNNGTCRKFKL